MSTFVVACDSGLGYSCSGSLAKCLDAASKSMIEPIKKVSLNKVLDDLERMRDPSMPMGSEIESLYRFVRAFARGGWRIILEPMTEKPSDQEG